MDERDREIWRRIDSPRHQLAEGLMWTALVVGSMAFGWCALALIWALGGLPIR